MTQTPTITNTFVTAESMQNRTIRAWTPGGQVDQPCGLRGTPIGDRAQVWEWDRMVTPPRRTRRVREHVKVMHCPEGWHSTSGGDDCPSGPAVCSTLLDDQWRNAHRGFDRAKFGQYHDEHPVVWVVRVTRGRQATTLHRCDPELPDEYRPDPDAEPCHDCRHLVPLDATCYAMDSAITCGPCGLARYGDRADEYVIVKAEPCPLVLVGFTVPDDRDERAWRDLAVQRAAVEGIPSPFGAATSVLGADKPGRRAD